MNRILRSALFLSTIALAWPTGQAAAQLTALLYSGVNIPQKNFGADAGVSTSPGLGGGVSLHYHLPAIPLRLGVALGAQRFSAKVESSPSKFSYKLITVPIGASLQYYLPTEGFESYLGVEGGLGYTNYEIRDSGKTTSLPRTGLALGGNGGVRFRATQNVDLDLNIGYQYISHGSMRFGGYYTAADFTTLGLRVGLGYSF